MKSVVVSEVWTRLWTLQTQQPAAPSPLWWLSEKHQSWLAVKWQTVPTAWQQVDTDLETHQRHGKLPKRQQGGRGMKAAWKPVGARPSPNWSLTSTTKWYRSRFTTSPQRVQTFSVSEIWAQLESQFLLPLKWEHSRVYTDLQPDLQNYLLCFDWKVSQTWKIILSVPSVITNNMYVPSRSCGCRHPQSCFQRTTCCSLKEKWDDERVDLWDFIPHRQEVVAKVTASLGDYISQKTFLKEIIGLICSVRNGVRDSSGYRIQMLFNWTEDNFLIFRL